MATTVKLNINTSGMKTGDSFFTKKPVLYDLNISAENLFGPNLSHIKQEWLITAINGPREAEGLLINETEVFLHP